MSAGILMLGAGGFLGSALARRLSRDGCRVYRVMRQPAPPFGQNDSVHPGDISDVALMRELLTRCNTVFHLASATTPGSSARQPSLEAEFNLLPTLRFLDVMQDFPGRRLIFVSSGGALYGNPAIEPAPETHPTTALSYHGAGKIALETFLLTFSRLTGTGLTVLRPSNLYGPAQSLKSGFGLVRTMLQHVKQGTTMQIWGDGETVRDFLYIDDMVQACCQVRAQGDAVGEVFNVGAGNGHSINQIRQLAEKITGRAIDVIYQPQRQVDVTHIVLDCSRIRSKLGWSPAVPLEEGLAITWQWLQSQAT
ncbi:MAG: NAD-dependent epimerase/dehydratase family protein [Burkholderiales bacterium]|nr:NAD-dependent epimerase/dehydratase family protein [Burkholderiales bacterium]